MAHGKYYIFIADWYEITTNSFGDAFVSFGNVDLIKRLFLCASGLYPYYDIVDEDAIQKATKAGPPYIDPRYKDRSYIEGRMVEAMNACHKVNATERVSIFWVVQHLRETRDAHRRNLKEKR